MSTEKKLMLPCGRIVQGHPMEGHQQKDNANQPKTMRDGSPLMSYYIAVALVKGAEQHWAQTEWGQILYAAGVEGWPNGEHGAPTFAWKVVDGDSTVPDRSGTSPSQKEGFPGHWVVRISSCFQYPCYHAGKYQAHEVIQNPKEIKCGDYVRVEVSTLGNGPVSQSPGIYINPLQLEVSRAGVQIISKSMPDAAGAFGTAQAVLPGNAMIDTAVAPVPVAGVPPMPGQVMAPAVVQPVAVQPVAMPAPGVPGQIPGVVAGQVPNVVQTVPGQVVAAPVIPQVQGVPVASSVPVAAGNPAAVQPNTAYLQP